jgi:hypothetical protein
VVRYRNHNEAAMRQCAPDYGVQSDGCVIGDPKGCNGSTVQGIAELSAGPTSEPGPPARRPTQASRQFAAEDLAAVRRPDHRKLIQLLLTEAGSRTVEFQTSANYDELMVESVPLWRRRRMRARIAAARVGNDYATSPRRSRRGSRLHGQQLSQQ